MIHEQYPKPTVTKTEKPNDEINETLEDKRFDYFLKRYLEIMKDKDVPEYFKGLLQQPDIMLVAVKLKPATDVEFITPYWDVLKENGIIDEDKVAQFKKIMAEKFNVLSTETNNRFDGKFFQVYNPKLIDQRIKTEFPELESWPKNNDLNSWFEANIQKGVSHHTLKGLYYGFPKSAINNWLKTLASEKNTVNEDTQTIFSPGETYIVPKGELTEDVKNREKEIEPFLKRVKNSGEIKKQQESLEALKKQLLPIRTETEYRLKLKREENQFEEFAAKYPEVLKDPDIPNIIKMFFRQKDILLVLGKLKPLTDITLQEDILEEWAKRGYWQNDSQEKLKQFLKEKFGLLSSENEKRPDDLITFRVYDPEQIKMRIKDFPDLLPWDELNNLENWNAANLNAGKSLDYLNGVLYGFPKSSIEFYLKNKGLADIPNQVIETGGEAYGIEEGTMPEDVSLREKLKSDFFQRIAKNQDIQHEFAKLVEIKNEIIAIKNKSIEKRTNHKVDISKAYE